MSKPEHTSDALPVVVADHVKRSLTGVLKQVAGRLREKLQVRHVGVSFMMGSITVEVVDGDAAQNRTGELFRVEVTSKGVERFLLDTEEAVAPDPSGPSRAVRAGELSEALLSDVPEGGGHATALLGVFVLDHDGEEELPAALSDALGSVEDLLRLAVVVVQQARAEVRLETVRQRLQLMQKLAEQMTDTVMLFSVPERILDARVVWANSAVQDLLDHEAHQVAEKRLEELLDPESASDNGPLLESIHAELKRLGPVLQQLVMRRADGEKVLVLARFLPIANQDGRLTQCLASFSSLHNSAARVMEARLREERLRALISESSDVLTVIDAEGRITFESPSVETVFGWSPDELVGRQVMELVHPADLNDALSGLARLAAESGTTANATYRFQRKDGTWCWVESRAINRLDDPDLRGMVVTTRDIDDRVRAEEELKRSEERIQVVLSSLDEAVCQVDEIGTVLVTNAAAGELLGIERGERLSFEEWDARNELGEPLTGSRDPLQQTLAGKALHREPINLRVERVGRRWMSLSTQQIAGSSKDEPVHCVFTFRDITEQREGERRLAHLAYHDSLTGLPNRSRVTEALQQAVSAARRRGYRVALLFVDLDRFKRINDSLGHGAGDLVLREAARRIQSAVRDEDTISRFGGDEFVVLLHRIDSPRGAAVVARRILEAFNPSMYIDGEEVSVGASVGIALYPDDAESAEEMLRNADRAMYAAKETGSGRFQHFLPDMNVEAANRLRLEAEMRWALERKEFELHYQPKFTVDGRQLTGVEALIRWNHRRRGMVSPGEFIPVAEESGQILHIGNWVLEEACRQIEIWRNKGLPDVPISVNVSAMQFQQADFVDRVESVLERNSIAGELIELELTETAVVRDPERVRESFNRLSRYGVRMSLDDFGTGFSSLSMLTRLPFNTLKVDRAFVSQLGGGGDAAACAMVEAIILIGHSRSMTVVAEGVEREEEVEALRALGCDQVQGFHFGRPQPASDMAEFIRKVSSS